MEHNGWCDAVTRWVVATLVASMLYGAPGQLFSQVPTDSVEGVPSAEETAGKLYDKAAAAYGKGDYSQAIQLLLQAHALSPDPLYAFNIALSYWGLDQCAPAREWADLAVRGQTPAQKLPEEAFGVLDQLAQACPKEVVIAKVDPDPYPDPDKKEGVGVDDLKKDPPPVETDWNLWSGVGTATLGTGMLVFGAVYDQGVADDIASLKSLQRTEDKSRYDSARANVDSGRVNVALIYSAGALALGTGIYLIFTSDTLAGESSVKPAAADAQPLGLVPILTPDFAGLGAVGQF